MTESRACPECGAEVPTGRLSCGACGALLASVHGREAAGAPADLIASAPEATDVPAAGALAQPAPAFEGVAPPMTSMPQMLQMLPSVEPPPMPPIPGGYLPPSAVMRGAPVPQPASPRTAPTSPSAAPRPPLPAVSGPESSEPGQARAPRVPVLELPFVIAPGIGPRLVASGAALAVVAFVLPWIPSGGVVIGGAFGNGYFATWGLAAIGNVLPFLLAWVSLLLAAFPTRVPRHVALGLLPVLLGGILAGFGWTYLIGPFGVGIGIWALFGGAFLLVAGGSLVIHNDRSAG